MLSDPYVCTECKGTGKVEDKPCVVCSHTGLVWPPEPDVENMVPSGVTYFDGTTTTVVM